MCLKSTLYCQYQFYWLKYNFLCLILPKVVKLWCLFGRICSIFADFRLNFGKKTWPSILINASKIKQALWMVFIKKQICNDFKEYSRIPKPYIQNWRHNKIPVWEESGLFLRTYSVFNHIIETRGTNNFVCALNQHYIANIKFTNWNTKFVD